MDVIKVFRALIARSDQLTLVKVFTISPNLPAIVVLLSQLSNTGDIYSFIREARRVFVDSCDVLIHPA
jgi:hypothetical protein